MNRSNLFLSTLFLALTVLSACQDKTEQNKNAAADQTTIKQSDKKERLLRHVVIFKFKDQSSAEDIDKVNKAFHALPEAIPVIKDFEWGLNHSPENFHQDFTHCYLVTFASEADRDSVYAPHPQHQAFVKILQPHLEKVFVVDYWTNP